MEEIKKTTPEEEKDILIKEIARMMPDASLSNIRVLYWYLIAN